MISLQQSKNAPRCCAISNNPIDSGMQWAVFIAPGKAISRDEAKKVATADELKLLDLLNNAGESPDSPSFVIARKADCHNSECPIARHRNEFLQAEDRPLVIAVGLTPGSSYPLRLAIKTSQLESPHLAKIMHAFHGTKPYVPPPKPEPTPEEREAAAAAALAQRQGAAIVKIALAIGHGTADHKSMRAAEGLLEGLAVFFKLVV